MYTMDELVEMMRECAGEDEPGALDGDVRGVPFADLGYDSLAVLNTLARIRQATGIALPDDILDRAPTPGALLAEINSCLARTAP